MAEQSFPFENIDTTESQFSEWATNFQETGVQGSPTGTELGITVTGSDLNLTIAAGQAFIRGHYYINTDNLVLAVPSAGVNTRIDIVVVELDPEANTIVTKIVSGTAVAADPVAPTLTQSATGIYQLPISTLTIPTSTVAITAGMLLDTRTFMGNRVGIWTTATRPANPTAYQTLGYNSTLEYHEYWGGTSWVALIAPPASANFVIDLDGTANNSLTFDFPKPAGPYSISLSEEDASFDVYLLDESGVSVGYTNNSAIVAGAEFRAVSILGLANTQIITFLFTGSVTVPDGDGNKVGAGAYLSSITPSDLPNIDDTATVVGGNFATDVEIYFESEGYSEQAKSIVRTDSTELVITRPDNLTEDNAPYNLRSVNAGVPQATGSGLNVLTDAVTAGSDPTWVTTSPLNSAQPGNAFSQTLSATDSDGEVVSYIVTAGTLTAGLSLDSSTGVLSGTPTTAETYNFTVRATDDGGNSTDKAFAQTVDKAAGGIMYSDGTYQYHSFKSSGDLTIYSEITGAEYLVVAGGGGGGTTTSGTYRGGGGGGAGGLLNSTSTLSVSTISCVVGSGGAVNSAGSNSVLTGIATALGGGRGAASSSSATTGGSGGGGSTTSNKGSGTSGQGRNGGSGTSNEQGGGGGGNKDVGQDYQYANGKGGDGTTFSSWATAAGITGSSGAFSGGGGGGQSGTSAGFGAGGLGGGGYGSDGRANSNSGASNTGGGGGGGGGNSATSGVSFRSGSSGGSGVIIVRYAI